MPGSRIEKSRTTLCICFIADHARVPLASVFCMITLLPRRLTSLNPCCASIRQASRPDIVRSLANCYL